MSNLRMTNLRVTNLCQSNLRKANHRVTAERDPRLRWSTMLAGLVSIAQLAFLAPHASAQGAESTETKTAPQTQTSEPQPQLQSAEPQRQTAEPQPTALNKKPQPPKVSARRGSTQSIGAQVVGTDRAPAGFLLIEEELVSDVHRLPFDLIASALREVRHRRTVAGSVFLRSASQAFQALSKGSGSIDAKRELTNAALELEGIAREVREGVLRSEAETSRRLAKVAYHTAAYHSARGNQEWSAKEFKRAGQNLLASKFAVEIGQAWSGATVDAKTLSALNMAEETAERIAEGTGWTTADADRALRDLNQAVSGLGRTAMGSTTDRDSVSGTTRPRTPGN